MTVEVETPIESFSGTADFYPFVWSSQEVSENKVEVDSELQIPGFHYEIENYDPDTGGRVVFYEEYQPGTSAAVVVYRETPITQQVQYQDFTSFPAEVHEFNLDKDTRILQEIIFGRLAISGGIDLDSDEAEYTVTITNTAGSDAVIPGWDCTTPLAGVFYGEITESAPDDEAATAKDDGYVWFEVLPDA